ncbi:hypothetical protein JBE04_05515 [Streptomyces sp. PRKS01-29]|nr:hypothetical protein [Streptomyces sabulosicollis]MBI0293965.1 hypothetical protein [Streptomyces sabulosicollis]
MACTPGRELVRWASDVLGQPPLRTHHIAGRPLGSRRILLSQRRSGHWVRRPIRS